MAKFGVTRLVRRGETYWFRMAVPRSLVWRFNCREIKGSLKTSDPFTARLRCRRLSNYIDALLCAIRNMPELPSTKIRSL